MVQAICNRAVYHHRPIQVARTRGSSESFTTGAENGQSNCIDQGRYTRKVGGERYKYDVKYSPGESVTWNARVYQEGVLKGSTSGVETDNHLEGEALRESIVTLVEVAIEGMQGIGE